MSLQIQPFKSSEIKYISKQQIKSLLSMLEEASQGGETVLKMDFHIYVPEIGNFQTAKLWQLNSLRQTEFGWLPIS